MQKAKQILKEIFGYDSFRPLQQEIIESIVNKKDCLVVMPTGGGKSLCYQIPALMFDGLTIVISPLISLMKDQVEQLRQLGVETALLNSSLSQKDYNLNFTNVKSGKAKLLYLAPESLQKDDISTLLNSVNVDCITVDEAHCISEWGHDFRKDYRQLGNFKKSFSSAVCIGLTATATPRVQDDIMKNLKMDHPKKFIASFDRPNLFLQVIPKREPFLQVIDFLNEHKNQSGIIYCFSRKQVDSLHDNLSELGYSTKPYHAGLSDDERNTNQDLFIKDEVQIIIATIAFGMGINKSNVRFVLHYDLPKNLESYYQEIGRSGRDGVRSDCLLLFSYADISKINYFIDQKEDERERLSAKVHLEAMIKYAETEICRRHPLINYFGEVYKIDDCAMCDNCLAEEDDNDKVDVTVYAQKLLSTLKRTGEVFGLNYIIDVLLGNDTDRILSNNHHNLSVFGVGRDLSKKQWQILAHQLIRKEIVIRDSDYGSLKLSQSASDVLFNNKKVFGVIKEPEVKRKKLKSIGIEYDQKLFELLRIKRKQIADKKGIPPFVIFADSSLIQMAKDFPQTENEFLRIGGVGVKKLESYGSIFLSIIKNYLKNNDVKQKSIKQTTRIKKSALDEPRHRVVAKAYNDGSSITELAEEYNVQEQTIVNHLARFTNEGNRIRLDGLLERVTIDKSKQKKVFNEFDENGTVTMRNIFEKFNGEISYNELHLLRVIYLNNRKK
ncbi:MAG: DNA helicase RecQ [Ignavibacteriales bacterium]|nr:DNA helicase RecQ [Ignavibacteriales bacterium]